MPARLKEPRQQRRHQRMKLALQPGQGISSPSSFVAQRTAPQVREKHRPEGRLLISVESGLVMKTAAVSAAMKSDPAPTASPASKPRQVGHTRAVLQLYAQMRCEISAAMEGPKRPNRKPEKRMAESRQHRPSQNRTDAESHEIDEIHDHLAPLSRSSDHLAALQH